MTLLLLQIGVVLVVTLACGFVAQRLGQAKVIGEIIGGILLGPSALGHLAPHLSSNLFPPASLGPFDVLSNLGLILFLFLIGCELDVDHLSEQKFTVTLSSAGSILLPFLLAATVAPFLRPRFAPPGTGTLVFLLFLGISVSITAFPVLARILEERNLQKSALGATALMCAALDDVCAWLLLAVALTLLPSKGASVSLLHRLLWLAGYVLIMLGCVRPLGRWLGRRWHHREFSYELLGLTVAFVLGSAAATDSIGIHPLFGAFLAGVCFPRVKAWQAALRARLDTIVSVLLLPIFFALTGLRTQLSLLSGSRVWLWFLLILFIAIVGKVGGAVIAARWMGQSWQNAFALGTLLNTRGLVELIVLNIAYNAHVFSPTLFAVLVLMALVTTMMTTPLLNRLSVGERALQPEASELHTSAV